MWFESLDNVENLMGEDNERSLVPEGAQTVSKRFDAKAKHFHNLDYLAS